MQEGRDLTFGAKSPVSSYHHLTALFVQPALGHAQPPEDAFVYDVKNNFPSWRMLWDNMDTDKVVHQYAD